MKVGTPFWVQIQDDVAQSIFTDSQRKLAQSHQENEMGEDEEIGYLHGSAVWCIGFYLLMYSCIRHTGKVGADLHIVGVVCELSPGNSTAASHHVLFKINVLIFYY